MNRDMGVRGRWALVGRPALLVGLALFLPIATLAQDLAVRAQTLHLVSGPAIDNGVVVIRDGRIVAVGVEGEVAIPEGLDVLEAAVVTPGLVDVHSTLGLSGIYGANAGQVRDQDQLEKSEPLQPDLRPVDAYNAHDRLIEWARQYGVTTLHTGHGPGALISGQTMVVKTRGSSVEEALVESPTALAVTLGPSISSNYKSPGTRAKSVAMLRQALIDAQVYAAKLEDPESEGKSPPRDLKKEALAQALAGEIKMMVTAHTVADLAAALRLQREFGFELLLDGASEAYRMLDEIRQAGVPVLLHPPMMRARGETRNSSIESGHLLQEAGIPFAIQTGFEGYVPKTRVLLFEAAIAAANGLSFEDTVHSITLSPARILGIDDRVGSIEIGKDGDLALFDGNPFEYTSHVCSVVIEGEVWSDECW